MNKRCQENEKFRQDKRRIKKRDYSLFLFGVKIFDFSDDLGKLLPTQCWIDPSILTADTRRLKVDAKCFTEKGAKIVKTMLL